MIFARAAVGRAAVVLSVLVPLVVAAIGCRDGASPAAAGKRLYRDGLLASGQPLTATVEHDVPVVGTQFSCVSCHLRSGMGSAEGQVGVPPVAGPMLYQAVEQPPHLRPAYTDATLARAIRDGIDAGGRRLDALMPRFRLSDQDVQALVAYLKTLSAQQDPGVTETVVRFATVYTDDVDPQARDAMFAVLDTYVAERDAQTRLETQRQLGRPAAHAVLANKGYRKWSLARWALHGPPGTWAAQLERYYRDEPPFALLSGLGNGEWRPIHEFCEGHAIPCLLPNTDLPAVADRDFYSLYFSKGLTLEAEAIADQVAKLPSPARVVQVFHEGDGGAVGAQAFRSALAGHAGVTIADVVLPPHAAAADRLTGPADGGDAAAVVLWLPGDQLAALYEAGWRPGRATILLSSTVLGDDLGTVPPPLRQQSVVAHPFLLPADRSTALRRVEAWLTSRGIKTSHTRIQAQTYFACLVAGDALMHLKWHFFRDYLLDVVDHLPSSAVLPAYYPNVSFGPGQRYLATGAYRLRLMGDGERPWIETASWVALGR